MFNICRTRAAVLTITAITMIGAASVPVCDSGAPTGGRIPPGTTISRSGTHPTELADTVWGAVRQSAVQAASPYNLINAWPMKYADVGA
jgi:hypothetical protein